jgi:hypothetical protein
LQLDRHVVQLLAGNVMDVAAQSRLLALDHRIIDSYFDFWRSLFGLLERGGCGHLSLVPFAQKQVTTKDAAA